MLQFRDTAAAKLSSFAILERVLRDQFETVDDECGDRDAKRAAIRDPKDVPCDTVGNLRALGLNIRRCAAIAP